MFFLDRIIYIYSVLRCITQRESLLLDRIIDVAIHMLLYRVDHKLRSNFGSISIVDLVDEIRWLPGSDQFALVEVRAVVVLVESIRSSLAGQIGVDGAAYGHKRNRGTNCPRKISLPCRDRRPSVRIFFSHHFYPSPPTLIFFLPENQFEARCNARYEHPEGDLVQAAAKKPEIS